MASDPSLGVVRLSPAALVIRLSGRAGAPHTVQPKGGRRSGPLPLNRANTPGPHKITAAVPAIWPMADTPPYLQGPLGPLLPEALTSPTASLRDPHATLPDRGGREVT